MEEILNTQLKLNELIKEEKRKLEDEMKIIALEKEQWKGQQKYLEKVQTNKIVKLNIGGTIFMTSLSTVKDTTQSEFFRSLFSGRWEPQHDENGCIFIDRDPTMFKYVLNHLRGLEVPLKIFTPEQKFLWSQESDFYQIPKQIEEINILDVMKASVSMSTRGGNSRFDDIFSATNTSAFENSYGSDKSPWIVFDFPKPFCLTKYLIRQDQDHFVRNWDIEGKNDTKDDWVLVDRQTNNTVLTPSNKMDTFVLSSPTHTFKMYRFILTGPSHKGDTNFDICQFGFWGYPQ
eukprot:TRINITY_DN7270_c0_g1_i1.p1 TRINITY_DN7270_c0_g1~~TRINITY_DN7270_c0_g1_i1.p1  ORF type:complete len:289 (-),score=44.09 TRINITY_DN7270_c0_g1_i1:28-894(-)